MNEFPEDGIKCIEKLQSHCANMNFAEKVDMKGFSSKSNIKEGNLKLITFKIQKIRGFISFCRKFLRIKSTDAHISG